MRSHIVSMILFTAAIGMLAPAVMAQQGDPPEWARGLIWYLVMPDRYWNGNTDNDPDAQWVFGDENVPWEVSQWTSNWYASTVEERMLQERFYPGAFLRQYGGDFAGLMERLDYLSDLGVEGLILTPIFEAGSAHKFDMRSLHHADRHFGPLLTVDTTFLNREKPEDSRTWYMTSADRAFAELVEEIHRRGMRVLLMAQFAHVSAHFWAFENLLERQENSQFGSWFTVRQWDKPETPYDSEFDYERMWGIDAFPKLRQDTLGLVKGPRDYVFASTARWMDPNGDGDLSDGVDGWCIDLGQELPLPFWEAWAAHCRSINPKALLVNLGDGWGKSAAPFDLDRPREIGRSIHEFLLSRRFTSTAFDAQMMKQRSRTTLSGSDMLFTMPGFHETDRIASMCVNDTLPYDLRNSLAVNPQYDVGPPDATAEDLRSMLLLLQFTLPGAPVLYYGDEAGMWGGDDPDNRKPMLWPELEYEGESVFEVTGDDAVHPVVFDSALHSYYKELIALRGKYTALRSGTMQTLLLDDVAGLYAFVRAAGAEKVYVAVNAGDKPQQCVLSYLGLPEGIRLHDPFHDISFYTRRDAVSFVLPPRSATLLVPDQ